MFLKPVDKRPTPPFACDKWKPARHHL
jgi:hypothetical protein